MAGVDPDFVIERGGGRVKFGAGGDGRVGTTFRINTTCNDGVNALTGEKTGDGQCFGMVNNTPEDRAAAEAYRVQELAKYSAGALLGEVFKPIKNLAAGVINGAIGSNLGDSDDPLRLIGESASSFVTAGIGQKIGKLVGIAGAIQQVEKIAAPVVKAANKIDESMSFNLGGLISAANSFITSPLGTKLVGLGVSAVAAGVPSSGVSPIVPLYPPASAPPKVVNQVQGTTTTTPAGITIPSWAWLVLGGVFLLVLKPFGRGRR